MSNIYTHPIITIALQANAGTSGSKGLNRARDTDTNKEIRVPPTGTGATTLTDGTRLSEV